MSRKRRASVSLQNGHVKDEKAEWRLADAANGHGPAPVAGPSSNWGAKPASSATGSEWARKGKIAPWGPGHEDFELQERARKRIRGLLPPTSRSPSPPIPTLAHMRPPSPPAVAPYAPPATQHANFMAFVLDESVQHAFRSRLLPDLQRATCNLIEGESDLKRALGRFWAVLADPPKPPPPPPQQHQHTNGITTNGDVSTKQEDPDDDDIDDDERAALRDDAMYPQLDKIFVSSHDVTIMGHTLDPRQQHEHLFKALGCLRDMQDDGREYVERLAELREGLGEICYQRQSIWNTVRERALKEMGSEGDR